MKSRLFAALLPLALCSASTRLAPKHAYRDGAREVSFTRTHTYRNGLERLELSTGARHWTAWVGTEAVVTTHDERALRGLTRVRTLSKALGIHLVRGRAGEDGAALASRLHASGLDAVPDLYRERSRTAIDVPPDDPRFGGQWYFSQLGVDEAWRWSAGDASITVAVVDNGFDIEHPELAGKFVGQRDLISGDDDARYVPKVRGNEHGTACAGIIAARTDNGIGIAGACPQCTLAGIRLINADENELTPLSADIAAFDYAFEIDAAVMSNSWGYKQPGPVEAPLAAAVTRLVKQGHGGRGTLVVFAAGNENRRIEDDELLAFPGVLAVSALNRYDEATPFVNEGHALDISAHAGTLTTDIAGAEGASSSDYTDTFGGTSSACPVVAGIAGLLRSAAPEASAEEVLEAILRSARRAPYASAPAGQHDPVYGYGIIDPVGALRALAPQLEPTPSDAGVVDAAVPIVDATSPARDAGGEEQDAGVQQGRSDAAVTEARESSGCALANSGGAFDPLWLLALAAWRKRRRTRS